jgi:hypothetical protein
MVRVNLSGLTTKSPTFISYMNRESIPAQIGIAPAFASGKAVARRSFKIDRSIAGPLRSPNSDQPMLTKDPATKSSDWSL